MREKVSLGAQGHRGAWQVPYQVQFHILSNLNREHVVTQLSQRTWELGLAGPGTI